MRVQGTRGNMKESFSTRLWGRPISFGGTQHKLIFLTTLLSTLYWLPSLNSDTMEADEEGMKQELAGFIFMCNKITKPECYRYRVFGLPAGRKEVVEKINPGTYLFLFDTDVKLLYGIYMASSTGKLKIEPNAFGGKFPAQVRFKIYKDCLPLPENCFRHAIQDNYQKNSNKFNPELNTRQVRCLLELFPPLLVLSTAPRQPVSNKIYSPSMPPLPPVHNVYHQISRPSLSEDAYLPSMLPNQAPRQLNYKHVNELKEPTGCAYPVYNLMPNSAAAQSVLSQASRNQLHAPASSLTPECTYATGMGSSYTQSLPDPQYTHQNTLNPQPEFHSSIVNRGNDHAQSLQDSQHAHHNVLHPQPDFHSFMITRGGSHAQSLQDPQYTHNNTLNPQPEFHSSLVNGGSDHAQSLPDSQYAHHNALHPQPEFHSQHAQSFQDPQHPHQSIVSPAPGFNSPVANVGSSHAQLSQNPHYTCPDILNVPPDSYSTMPSMGSSSYLQPNFNSSLVGMDHANVMMQSYAASSLYCPYVPQEVVSSTSSYQGFGVTQGVLSSGEQPGMRSEHYQPSMNIR